MHSAVGLGGMALRRVQVNGDVSWIVLADPEGNEFCVLAPA
ncbi:VOC family protein [Microbispora bryophytorum]